MIKSPFNNSCTIISICLFHSATIFTFQIHFHCPCYRFWSDYHKNDCLVVTGTKMFHFSTKWSHENKKNCAFVFTLVVDHFFEAHLAYCHDFIPWKIYAFIFTHYLYYYWYWKHENLLELENWHQPHARDIIIFNFWNKFCLYMYFLMSSVYHLKVVFQTVSCDAVSFHRNNFKSIRA